METLIELFGDQNISPLPVGLRSGNLIRGFRIVGADPETGKLGANIETQLKKDSCSTHFKHNVSCLCIVYLWFIYGF